MAFAQTTKAPPGEINIKEAELEAHDIVKEGKDTQEEVIKKFIEKDKILEHEEALQKETESFEEALHHTSLQHAAQQKTASAVKPVAPVVEEKSEFLLQVENILSENLGDIYLSLDPTLRERFKQKGEEVARKIEEVTAQGKAKVKQIIAWIKEWLRMIPGVSRFFLEQEAKIKGDKIITMLQK